MLSGASFGTDAARPKTDMRRALEVSPNPLAEKDQLGHFGTRGHGLVIL